MSTAAAAGVATVSVTLNVKRAMVVLAAGLSSASAIPARAYPVTVGPTGSSSASASIGVRRGIIVRADGQSTIALAPRRRSARTALAAGHATVSAGIDFVHAGSHLTQIGLEVLSVVLPPAYLSLSTYSGVSGIVVPIVADSCDVSYVNAADLARAKDGTQRGVFFSAPRDGNRRVWKVTTDLLTASDATAIAALLAANPLCVAGGYWIESAVLVWPSSVSSVPINGPGGTTLETLTFTLTEA